MSHQKANKDRVLILVNHDVVIYNFRKELVERLLNEGYEVFISSPQGERIRDLVNMGCKYVEATVERRSLNPVAEHKLLNYYKRIVAEVNPGVVLTYTVKPNIYGGLACQKLGVAYISNVTGLGSSLMKPGSLHWMISMLYKRGLRGSACVFFQNEENLRFFLRSKIFNGKYRLIPGSGVNVAENSYKEYPNHSERVNFLYLGRVMREKGIEEFIGSAEKVKRLYPSVEFNVAGWVEEEEYEEKLTRLTNEGTINYHGWHKDVSGFLSSAHAVVSPSYHEGMSNVLLESASTGRPVIASNIPGCRETFEDGVSGLAFEPRNVKDLTEKLIKFIELPYEKKKAMGIAGRRKVEKEFDRNIVIDAYMEEINKIRNALERR